MRISITDVQSMSSTNRSQIARTKASQPKWRHITDQDLKDETGLTVTPDFKRPSSCSSGLQVQPEHVDHDTRNESCNVPHLERFSQIYSDSLMDLPRQHVWFHSRHSSSPLLLEQL